MTYTQEKPQIIATSCICCGNSGLRTSPAILMPFVAHRAFGWRPVTIDASWDLQTVPFGQAYSVCNSLLCTQCGLLFLDIRFDDAAMSRLYANYRSEQYTDLRESYEPGYRARNVDLEKGVTYLPVIEAFLRPLLPERSLHILDWGGDTGINTPFKGQGHCIDIYDISNVAPQRGFSRVSHKEACNGIYDLIVCSNVLEHAPDPVALLIQIRRLMHHETILYIEVPHEPHMRGHTSGEAQLRTKRHWHEHINFFTANALRALVARVSMELVSYEDKEMLDGGTPGQFFVMACRSIGNPL